MIRQEQYSGLMSVYYKENPEYLKRALESIREQSSLPKTMILIEDGKLSVGLSNVISEEKKIFESKKIEFILIKNKVNEGLAPSLNKGLKECKTNLVARFDSDDINLKNRMEKTLSVFQNRPQYAVVGSWAGEFSEKISKISDVKKVPEKQEDIKKFSKHRNPVNHMTVTFKSEVIKNNGGYPIIADFEDYALWNKLLQRGEKFYNIPRILVYARADENFVGRRRGWKYLRHELTFQNKMKKMGYFSHKIVFINVLMRGIIRILPVKVLTLVYSTLRKNDKKRH